MDFGPLTDAERDWVEEQIGHAAAFARSGRVGELPSIRALDDAFEAFIGLGEEANERANSVVLAVGVAFGEHLVRALVFQWCIATDNSGTDIAVVTRRGRGDITIFPTNFVAKRWESRESRFLVRSVAPISKAIQESAAASGDD